VSLLQKLTMTDTTLKQPWNYMRSSQSHQAYTASSAKRPGMLCISYACQITGQQTTLTLVCWAASTVSARSAGVPPQTGNEPPRWTPSNHPSLTTSTTLSCGMATELGWVVVSRPARHKIGHFGDVSSSQSLGLAWKKTRPNTTKAHTHQSKEM